MGRMAIHKHTQSTPATVWTITHGLACRPAVSVKVYDNAELVEILPHKIEAPNDTTVVITFTTARTGEARLV